MGGWLVDDNLQGEKKKKKRKKRYIVYILSFGKYVHTHKQAYTYTRRDTR